MKPADDAYLFAKRKINPDTGCWEWTGAKTTPGYGYFVRHVDGSRRSYLVTRVAAALWLGLGDDDRRHVLHGCDNPPCFRPGDGHLHLGSARMNAVEREARNPWLRAGVANGRVKLLPEQVKEIRERMQAGETQTAIALAFGISQPQVSRIARGVHWKE